MRHRHKARRSGTDRASARAGVEGSFTVATIFQQFCINFERKTFSQPIIKLLSRVDCQPASQPAVGRRARKQGGREAETAEKRVEKRFQEKDLMKFSTIIPLRDAKRTSNVELSNWMHWTQILLYGYRMRATERMREEEGGGMVSGCVQPPQINDRKLWNNEINAKN